MSIWTRQDLEKRIRPGLMATGSNLRKEIIKIAETKQPEMAFDLVKAKLLSRGFASKESKIIARSASWLAVAKRENEEWFSHIVAKLS